MLVPRFFEAVTQPYTYRDAVGGPPKIAAETATCYLLTRIAYSLEGPTHFVLALKPL